MAFPNTNIVVTVMLFFSISHLDDFCVSHQKVKDEYGEDRKFNILWVSLSKAILYYVQLHRNVQEDGI